MILREKIGISMLDKSIMRTTLQQKQRRQKQRRQKQRRQKQKHQIIKKIMNQKNYLEMSNGLIVVKRQSIKKKARLMLTEILRK